MNVAHLDFTTANCVVLAVSLRDRLGYIAVMPPASRARAVGCRRARHLVLSDDGGLAVGAAILLHVAVLPDDDPDPSCRLRSASARQLGTWGLLAAGGRISVLSLRRPRPTRRPTETISPPTIVLAAGLVWHLLASAGTSTGALPSATGRLKPLQE